jgi:hypothetical protein
MGRPVAAARAFGPGFGPRAFGFSSHSPHRSDPSGGIQNGGGVGPLRPQVAAFARVDGQVKLCSVLHTTAAGTLWSSAGPSAGAPRATEKRRSSDLASTRSFPRPSRSAARTAQRTWQAIAGARHAAFLAADFFGRMLLLARQQRWLSTRRSWRSLALA